MIAKSKVTYADIIRPLDNFSAEGLHGCTTCKQNILVQIRIEGDVIVDAGGAADGCEYSRQCLAALLTLIKGMDVADAYSLTNEDLHPKMAKVNAKLDCDTFTVGALKIALRNWEKKAA